MFVFMSVVVTVGMFVVFFSLGVVRHVVCLWRACNGCCAFSLNCEAWSCMCSLMGNMSVFHANRVAVLSAAFYMTFSVVMLVDDARGDHIYTRPPYGY